MRVIVGVVMGGRVGGRWMCESQIGTFPLA
jgi:hypothetical protein